ncbi:MAG: STAS domain-containing protein [Acidobacteriota bacterium]
MITSAAIAMKQALGRLFRPTDEESLATVDRHEEGEVVVLRPRAASLTGRRVRGLAQALEQVESGTRVLVELDDVMRLDSHALAALLSTSDRLNQTGGEMALTGLQPPVRALAQLVRLHVAVDVFEDRSEAIRGLERTIPVDLARARRDRSAATTREGHRVAASH